VLRHHLQHLRKIYQRDKRRIESLFLRRVRQLSSVEIGVLLQPVINIKNFLRIGRGSGDLREQRIRIKRDRSQQLIQFLRCGGRGLRLEQRPKVLKNQR
jgi:hypothetical protein